MPSMCWIYYRTRTNPILVSIDAMHASARDLSRELIYYLNFFFPALGMEPRAVRMLGKHLATFPAPSVIFNFKLNKKIPIRKNTDFKIVYLP